MQDKPKRPIVNSSLVRYNPRLAARIQVEHFRKRLSARLAERKTATQRHSSDDKPAADLVGAWWQTNHPGETEQS